jgi:hypothetical protein
MPRFAISFQSPGAIRHGRFGPSCLAIRGTLIALIGLGAMQKRHVDSLLYGSIVLLASSILGFIYLLWQTYRMAVR